MAALRKHPATRLQVDQVPHHTEEALAEELAIALLFNGVPFAVMMATPADLHDYAVGFALSEGIIHSAEELELIDQVEREMGIALHLGIPGERFAALEQRRHLIGPSGCGFCGSEHLEQVVRTPPALVDDAQIPIAELTAALAQLSASQPLNQQCGALHAAAAITDAGLLVREDVGRHNALDKVIGALARTRSSTDAILVTSRASYELVHKVATARIPLLAAVSAPTAHAVRLAQQTGLTLIGFARESRMTVYAGAQRLRYAAGPSSSA